MRYLIVTAVLAMCLSFYPAELQAACQTHACWHRVHVKRADNWCQRHESCAWRLRFKNEPVSWQNWYHNTADCETRGYEPNARKAKVDTGNNYEGAVQFSKATWDSAQKYLPPRLRFYGNIPSTSYEHQGVVAIELAQHEGTGHWPRCG
jgi:Transglycosylase-like domain